MIGSGDRGLVAMSFLIGAAVMAVAGVVELVLGVKAEGRPLEDLALPLTAEEGPADAEPPDDCEREARIAARAERHRAGQLGRTATRPSAGWNAPWREAPSLGAEETALDHEIETIARAVQEHDAMSLRDLHRAVGARSRGRVNFARPCGKRWLRTGLPARTVAGSALHAEAAGRRSELGMPNLRSPTRVSRRRSHHVLGVPAVRPRGGVEGIPDQCGR